MSTTQAKGMWTNWVGNQGFTPDAITHPTNETDVLRELRSATADRRSVRVVGAGHSFTPLIENPGAVMDVGALSGVICTDVECAEATIGAGTPISQLGEPLWDDGLSLANQGDIDSQTIAGAISTGTHGSGIEYGSLSSTMVAARLVTPAGDVLSLSEDDELLRAAQVAVGTLGVLTQVTLKTRPAYYLDEQLPLLPVDEVLDGWDSFLRDYRHFSFFWLPTERSAALYNLKGGSGAVGKCLVKLYREADEHAVAEAGHRIDRAYRIYPSVFEPNFHEMEYMVPLSEGQATFIAIRDLVMHRFPACEYPVEFRFTAADRAMLSPNYERDSAVISISGEPGTDYLPFLRAADEIFDAVDGRPHWGKLHFLDAGRMERLYPEIARFREIRRELDPHDVLLNEHLRPLLG